MTANRSRALVKALVALTALGVIGFLFMRSLDDTMSEPYTVAPAHVDAWRLVLDASGGAASPMLSLQARPELVSNLSRQVFRRVMESTASPQDSLIPLVMRGEFDRSLRQTMSGDQLLAEARAAGLESARHDLHCLARHRQSEGRTVRQVYFVLVNSASIGAFRESLRRSAAQGFDPAAVTPAIVVAHSESSFGSWLPIRASAADCIAPIRVE